MQEKDIVKTAVLSKKREIGTGLFFHSACEFLVSCSENSPKDASYGGQVPMLAVGLATGMPPSNLLYNKPLHNHNFIYVSVCCTESCC